MSKIISAQVSGDLEEKFVEAAERRGADESRSAFIRDVIDEGLDAREKPLFVQLDIPDRMAAHLEADREDGESQEAVIVRHLREAIEARERDSLDELDVDDDLREAIEAAAEDGEPIDDAARRLLRAAAEEEKPTTVTDRITTGVGLSIILGLPALYAASGYSRAALVFILLIVGFAVFDEEVDRVVTHTKRVMERTLARFKSTVK